MKVSACHLRFRTLTQTVKFRKHDGMPEQHLLSQQSFVYFHTTNMSYYPTLIVLIMAQIWTKELDQTVFSLDSVYLVAQLLFLLLLLLLLLLEHLLLHHLPPVFVRHDGQLSLFFSIAVDRSVICHTCPPAYSSSLKIPYEGSFVELENLAEESSGRRCCRVVDTSCH